ncbi:hypothetical protein ACFRJ9_15805 [Paenarthrobacter sp. NPDC056912]|uniref:hypothetical protein n=1 Tax=Paenarthrobacter sp. NPDC056912 TaxID=3345965 RepID=UPI003670DD69
MIPAFMVEVLARYSNRASFKIDKLNIIRDALDRIDAGKLRRPLAKHPRPTHRYRLTDRFTPDELNQLVARYQAGEMSTALAKESGIAKTSLLRLLKEKGVDTRTPGLTDIQKHDILHLRKQGLGIRTIANRLGCAYGTTRLFLLAQSKD